MRGFLSRRLRPIFLRFRSFRGFLDSGCLKFLGLNLPLPKCVMR
jgi:hypothetical protein